MRTPPELHPNFFLACIQLIFWVFFKPLTLDDYTGTLIPGFEKGFTLWSARKQINSRLKRLLKLQFVATVIAPWLIAFPLILLFQWAAMGEINLLKAAFGVAFGVAVGVAVGISFILAYFRVVYYWLEFPFHLLLSFQARASATGLNALKFSPVFWDDIIWFPLPFLDQMLRQGFHQDNEEGLELIAHVGQSFRKERYAFSALAWITADTLEQADSPFGIMEKTKSVNWLPENLEGMEKDIAEIFPSLQAITASIDRAIREDIFARRLAFRDALERLDTLNKRIPYLGRIGKDRWEQVIDQWQKVIADELNGLSASTGRTENPFQTGNPLELHRKDLFKGRKELRDRVVNALLERNRPTLVLHGPRRMGKTSFLLQLPALLPGHTIPVFLNLQRPAATQTPASFFYRIARGISRDARPYRVIIPMPERKQFETSPFEAFEDWLEDMCLPALKDFNLLLTFDEFEKLGQAIEIGKLGTDVLDELRTLIQHETQMAFLFAGVQTLEALGPNASSYFINVSPMSISYLKPEEARELITDPDPQAEFTLTYDETVIFQIMEITRCHPYLVQLVCSALVEAANAAETSRADMPLLEKAIPHALEQGELYFRNVWDETAGPDGQPLLRQIAASDTPMGFEEAGGQVALSRMVKHRVLTLHENGTYEVEVPLIRQWVTGFAPVE